MHPPVGKKKKTRKKGSPMVVGKTRCKVTAKDKGGKRVGESGV